MKKKKGRFFLKNSCATAKVMFGFEKRIESSRDVAVSVFLSFIYGTCVGTSMSDYQSSLLPADQSQ